MSSVDPRLWALIKMYSAKYNLDPRAVAAVSIMEGGGRFGAVGDNNSSYGPFQLHVGGALPAGKGAGWANSPQGIEYAIRQMGRVAGGLTGKAAIQNIVARFERPANVGAEVAGAWGHYSGLAPGGAVSAPVGAAGGGVGAGLGGGVDQSQALAQQLMNFAATGSMQGDSSSSPFSTIMQAAMVGAQAQSLAAGGGLGGGTPMVPSAAGWSGNEGALRAAMSHAQQMGLRVGENSLYDHVDPVHATGSFHYQHYKDGVNRAADISGSPRLMAAFYRWVLGRYGGHISELFYDPIGGIKYGKPIGAIGGHSDHVHVAF